MSPRVFWVGMIVGLLGLSVAIHLVMLFFAVGDPSFAIDPEYQAAGSSFQDVQRQRDENRRLGWSVQVSTRPAEGRGRVEVELRVSDDLGHPIDDATIEVATFHNARASQVVRAALPSVGGGVYGDTLTLGRSGIWEFRVTVRRGTDVFTQKVKKSVLSPI